MRASSLLWMANRYLLSTVYTYSGEVPWFSVVIILATGWYGSSTWIGEEHFTEWTAGINTDVGIYQPGESYLLSWRRCYYMYLVALRSCIPVPVRGKCWWLEGYPSSRIV